MESEENDKYSKPLVWIGVYMVIASLVCIPAMVADLLHGWRNERYQIRCKYFSLNVTSMMLIAIAMKLPVDLSGSMPGNLDQVAKVGSIAFMCTILAVFNPSLASMNNKTLISNIIGLSIFVVTIAVNLIIQIVTGVIKNGRSTQHLSIANDQFTVVKIYYSFKFSIMAIQYTIIMILMLLISISTSIIIPSIKKNLEFKYQVRRKALSSTDHHHHQQHTRISTVEELTEHVTRYWIMAKTGDPQFVVARNFLSYTSLFCFFYSSGIYVYVLIALLIQELVHGNYESDYEWSIPFILFTQFIGIVIGSLIVIVRCFKSLIFDKDSWNHLEANCRKEKYWTEKLCEWKESHKGSLSNLPRSSRIFLLFMKKCVLSLCIGLQKAFVVSICQCSAIYCIKCLILVIKIYDALISIIKPVVSRNDDIYRGLGYYALHLDDEVQPSEEVVENIAKSMNRVIERAQKQQSDNLLELLGKYNGFEGVEQFDHIDTNFGYNPLPDSVLNSWSVPVITLSCLAIAVPGISKEKVDSLIKSIDKALLYIHHVEESFNSTHEFVDIRKASMTLWYEVKDNRKWLGNSIREAACEQRPRKILVSFAGKAEAMLKETETSTNTREHMINFPAKLIAAHSMFRTSNSILSTKYVAKFETQECFFEFLSSMIADILVACFSNIPRVIRMKCHANEIEKREASVEAAAKLLGRSTEILRKLEACELPRMDPEKMTSIDEWRRHLSSRPIP